jgi:hypothetical protein
LGILDFREIPSPVKSKTRGVDSKDLDAFEKFAEEFFEKILGAEIIVRMRRGADNGLDLKIKLDNQVQLVSCKHYAHSGNDINTKIEDRPFEATTSNHCEKFVGFYSTAATGGLIANLEGCKSNPNYKFDYKIYKSSDIESALLDCNNAKGWLLAARYFPSGFGNLFRRFVVPIEHYKTSDLKKCSGGWVLDGPYGGNYCSNHNEKQIVSDANDSITSSVHISFFKEAIRDAIRIFPRYFVFKKGADKDFLELEDISPAWDEKLDYKYPVECNVPIIVCAIWSFWDSERSINAYKKFRTEDCDEFITERFKDIHIPSILSLGTVAKYSSGIFRDLFARLVAFKPASMDYLVFYKLDEISSFELDKGSVIDWEYKSNTGLAWLNDSI